MKNKIFATFFGIIVFAISYWAVTFIWPIVGIDWHETYYPAVQATLQSGNPFEVSTFRNVPWTILLLLPFGIFSKDVGGILYFMANLAGYAWVAYRLKAGRIAFIAFMFSSPVIYGLRMLNVDFLVLMGFVLPAPLGLFFVLIKPQMGLAMVFYWLAEAWYAGGVRSVLKTFLPVTISLGLTFVFYGNWLAGRQSDLYGSTWNSSLWPWALPIGLVLTLASMRERRKDFGMAASPFLSPYLAYHSWVSVLAGLMTNEFYMVIAVIGMWIAGIIHGLGL